VVAPGGKRGREHGVVLKRGTLKKKGLHLEEVKRNRRFFRRRGVFIFSKKERLLPVTTVRSGYRIDKLSLALVKNGC